MFKTFLFAFFAFSLSAVAQPWWKLPQRQTTLDLTTGPTTNLQAAYEQNLLFRPLDSGGISGDFMVGTNISGFTYSPITKEWSSATLLDGVMPGTNIAGFVYTAGTKTWSGDFMVGTNIAGLDYDPLTLSWLGLSDYLLAADLEGLETNALYPTTYVPKYSWEPLQVQEDDATRIPLNQISTFDIDFSGAGVVVGGNKLAADFNFGTGVFTAGNPYGKYLINFSAEINLQGALGNDDDIAIHYRADRDVDLTYEVDLVVAQVRQAGSDTTLNSRFVNWTTIELLPTNATVKFQIENVGGLITDAGPTSGDRSVRAFINIDYLGPVWSE